MSTINRSRLTNFTVGLIALSFGMVAWSSARAMPISIDLGASPNLTSHLATMFSDLNGTQLQGQTISLDFLFANGKFVRLFSATSSSFDASIALNTNGSGVVGFLSGTGYLLDQNGNALGSPEMLGSASGDDGSLFAGLFPLSSNQFSRPFDFFGVHFDLLLPSNLSVSVTGGEFALTTPGANHRDVFGVGPGVPTDIVASVPDSGSTLLFFSAVLFTLPVIHRWALAA